MDRETLTKPLTKEEASEAVGAFIALTLWFAFWAALAIGAIAAATWVVVKVLQWTGVL